MLPTTQTGLPCNCKIEAVPCKLVVVTGGPGAGKTAVLELVRRSMCEHVAVLPEAASIVFGGGFWRHDTLPGRKAAQRAILHVQRQLERIVVEEARTAVALCDRGTIDGLAYWPGEESEYWDELGVSKEEEFQRYTAVIHLHTPSLEAGYNHENPVRNETAEQAALLDNSILQAWRGHPRRFEIESTDDFLVKAAKAVELIRRELPECCRAHAIKHK